MCKFVLKKHVENKAAFKIGNSVKTSCLCNTSSEQVGKKWIHEAFTKTESRDETILNCFLQTFAQKCKDATVKATKLTKF